MDPAGEWPSRERANFGGTFAVEKSVIENWLEIEAGLTMLDRGAGSTCPVQLITSALTNPVGFPSTRNIRSVRPTMPLKTRPPLLY
jgi:hypothetical protein